MRRTLTLVVATLLVLGASVAVALISDDEDGPLPSIEQLHREGFAVWPEDTLAEGLESCESAQRWQLDPEDTALTFAREVFHYPPELDLTVITEPQRSTDMQFIVHANPDDLGTSVSVRKYGRCWFVIRAEPRESAGLPSITFGHAGGSTKLLVHTQGVAVDIGYGADNHRIGPDTDFAVIEIPDVDPDATGHVISAGNAIPLGPIPQPAVTPVRQMNPRDIASMRGVCDPEEVHKHPHTALGEFLNHDLGRQTGSYGARGLELRHGDTAREIADKKWALTIQGKRFIARVPRIKQYCWRVITVDDDPTHSTLRSLRVGPDSATFELAWGRATSASVTLSTESGAHRWSVGRFEGPISGRTFNGWSTGDRPIEVTVVLRNERNLVAVERTWWSPPDS